MKQIVITLLLTFAVVTLKGQVLQSVPERVLNHQMDMKAPLPEPLFKMDTTVVRVHILNWKPSMCVLNIVNLNIQDLSSFLALNYTGQINNDGLAFIRIPLRGVADASIGIDNDFSSYFLLNPADTTDVYVDLPRMREVCRAYMEKQSERVDYGFGNDDVPTAEQAKRHMKSNEYSLDTQPFLWFEGGCADLNTALHRYMPFLKDNPWNMDLENRLMVNKHLSDRYVDDMLKWRDYLKKQIKKDKRLPLCAKQYISLSVDLQAERCLRSFIQHYYRGDVNSIDSSSKENAMLKQRYISILRSLGTNTNYRAYLKHADLLRTPYNIFSGVFSDNELCDYLHDITLLYNYSSRINNDEKLSGDEMEQLRMPFYRNILQQQIDAQQIVESEEYNGDLLEDLRNRYKGKVVLIDFWNTACHGCIMMMNYMEPLKDTILKHPDAAFVYVTDHVSPVDRWLEFRERIRGEHIRLNDKQKAELDKQFSIRTLPTYILKDRQGNFRNINGNLNDFKIELDKQ
ncbi:MAG: hypothetical protein K5874_09785 [Bacteroidaceae bacterium]|nr:hypothetical protein [Bacteroidaceae bacterium]